MLSIYLLIINNMFPYKQHSSFAWLQHFLTQITELHIGLITYLAYKCSYLKLALQEIEKMRALLLVCNAFRHIFLLSD